MIGYVRTMEEVNEIPYNGLNVVSTFSGCGGSCLGYRIAGYKVIWANEFLAHAQATYRANHPETYLNTANIRDLQAEDIIRQCEGQSIDLLDGSPPCAAFSTSGRRHNNWGKVKDYSDTAQVVDDLFFEYARILSGLKPKVFIAENVTGLMKGKAKGYYNTIYRALRECGYNVVAITMNSMSYSVPQTRERIFFVGYRDDLPLKEPSAPAVHPKVLRICDFEDLKNIREFMKPGKPNQWSPNLQPYPTVVARIGNLSQTAYLSANGYVRDYALNMRKLTLRECRVIQSFPINFKLPGNDKDKKYERLGRAVPPVMMANLASHIAKEAFSVKRRRAKGSV